MNGTQHVYLLNLFNFSGDSFGNRFPFFSTPPINLLTHANIVLTVRGSVQMKVQQQIPSITMFVFCVATLRISVKCLV
jgi:hypothetical protein